MCGDLFLDSHSVSHCAYFCSSTTLFWFLLLCRIIWSQGSWCFHFFLFSLSIALAMRVLFKLSKERSSQGVNFRIETRMKWACDLWKWTCLEVLTQWGHLGWSRNRPSLESQGTQYGWMLTAALLKMLFLAHISASYLGLLLCLLAFHSGYYKHLTLWDK